MSRRDKKTLTEAIREWARLSAKWILPVKLNRYAWAVARTGALEATGWRCSECGRHDLTDKRRFLVS